MDYGKLIDIGSKVSLAVVLIVIIYTGSLGMWVFGTQYKEMTADRDTWKQLALQGTKVAQQAARPVIGAGPTRELTPLPANPTPDDVRYRLRVIQQRSAYLTEPTDEPE